MNPKNKPSKPPTNLRRYRGAFSLRIFLANTAMVCGSLIFLFVAAELALRVLGVAPQTATALSAYFQYDAETGWRGQPNVAMDFTTTAFTGYTSHGQDGFRTISKSPQDASTVVWCLGDSGTWGWGVNDGETYVDRLNERSDAQTVFRNLGVCGFSTAQQHLLLQDMLNQQKVPPPDLVLVLFCWNDLPENVDWKDQSPARPYYSVKGDEVQLRNYPTPVSVMNWRAWLKRHSLAYNHLNFHLMRAKQALKNRKATHQNDVPPPRSEQEWIALKHGYSQIRDLCAQQNIKFVPIFLPPGLIRQGLDIKPESQAWDDELRRQFDQMANGLSLEVLDISDDVLAYFKSKGQDAPRLSFVGDPHFNAIGHQLIADSVGRVLSRFLPIASPAHSD